jgi:four helix bundle protein
MQKDKDTMRSKYDLEDRLLEYAAAIIRLVQKMPDTRPANHVGGQLLRSGTSPLFNHGEAQAAESPRDFVHKMKVCLKELRETQRALRLVKKVPLTEDPAEVDRLLQETEELIRIFVASIRTAEKNVVREKDEEGYKV